MARGSAGKVLCLWGVLMGSSYLCICLVRSGVCVLGLARGSVLIIRCTCYPDGISTPAPAQHRPAHERRVGSGFIGLALRAVISVAPDDVVLARAVALDAERARGHVRGPFHGIPILLKVSAVCAGAPDW